MVWKLMEHFAHSRVFVEKSMVNTIEKAPLRNESEQNQRISGGKEQMTLQQDIDGINRKHV